MRRIYTLTILGFLCLTTVVAKVIGTSGLVVIDSKAVVNNDSLYVNINMDIDKLSIKSREGLVLTPFIRTAGQNMELPAVFIGGKNKYKSYHREQAFGGNEIAFISMRAKNNETTVVNYSYVLAYEPWMKTATVSLQEEIYGCADCRLFKNDIPLLANIDLPVRPLWIAYVTPPVEVVKARDMQGKAYLDFEVNKSVILPDFKNNPVELKKIHEVVSGVRDNRYATVTSIEVTGYASPEGPYELNEKLSKDRAFALKEYLQNKYGYKADLFQVNWKGEDWDGLKMAVESSDLKDKSQALEIINSSATYAIKDQKMKRLSDYKMLLSEYYPPLRRVEYRLNYTIKAFTVVEGVEIFKTSPAQLSLNEMFLVANKYPKGSKEFNDVFDVAVRIYPMDPIANINAGAIELEKGDAKQAHRFLDNYESNPQAWNNIGVMYIMEGDFDRAAMYLNKALPINEKEAIYNMEQLKIRKSLK